MKLSQLPTDEALDIFCELTPLIADIVSDEELMGDLKDKLSRDDMTTAELFAVGMQKIDKIINVVFHKKKAVVYKILAVLNHKKPEEIAAQNFLATGAQVREIVKDRDLWDFFTSFARTAKSE